ncbi:N-acetyltransferase [Rhizocola hellebori]|uniref:N-acetyltransferase n=1 Tax=Rhizocola hellebori TaxID=1392758 RepID=A0A8J3VKP4_9ACTN|nr:GNAT family N-acetyltransferase [Rhizocola hellebori]GIH09747.1 N-acetyltransferase [Rhizocola hellebori]
MGLTLRAARPGEAAELTELVMRSKAHWGYDEEFLDRVRPALTVGDHQLPTTVVAEYDGREAGVATLIGEPPEGELDLLFVDPWAIGLGIGKALFLDSLDRARLRGFTRLLIESDPYAEEFYLHMGAVRIGETVSSATGRSLPLLAYEV